MFFVVRFMDAQIGHPSVGTPELLYRTVEKIANLRDFGKQLSCNRTALRHIVPDCHDGSRKELGKHVVKTAKVDKDVHADLVQEESCQTCPEEQHLLTLRLVASTTEDVDNAEPVIDGDGCREGECG